MLWYTYIMIQRPQYLYIILSGLLDNASHYLFLCINLWGQNIFQLLTWIKLVQMICQFFSPYFPSCPQLFKRWIKIIHRINLHQVDSAMGFPNAYLLDSDLSGGWRDPTFEQLELVWPISKWWNILLAVFARLWHGCGCTGLYSWQVMNK